MATLTFGDTAGTYPTLKAAFDAASNNDILRQVSDVHEPAMQATSTGALGLKAKTGIVIDRAGDYKFLTTDGAGAGGGGDAILLWGCKYIRVIDLDMEDLRAGAQTYGGTVTCTADTAYVLMQGCTVAGYPQGMVGVPCYFTPGAPTNQAHQYLWADANDFSEIGAAFANGPSAVSFYQPKAISGLTRPTWWNTQLSSIGYQNDDTLTFLATRNRVDTVYDTGVDSDGNAVILADDWELEQQSGTHTLPAYVNGTRRALAENNSAYNCRGSVVRAFNSRSPLIIRNNTGVDCGQRRPGAAAKWDAAAYSISDSNGYADPHTWGAVVENNVAKNCGLGYHDNFRYNVAQVTTGSTYRNNAAHGSFYTDEDMANVATDPQLDSLTDPSLFNPGATSPLLAAGYVNGILLDNPGQVRPTPPSIGAFELVGAPPLLDGQIVLHDVTHFEGTPNFTMPAILNNGDLVIVFGNCRSSNDRDFGNPSLASTLVLPPTGGFTLLHDLYSPASWASQGYAFYKIAAASEAGDPYTVTHADMLNSEFDITVARFSGADPTTPIGASATSSAAFQAAPILTVDSPGTIPASGGVVWQAVIQNTTAEPSGVTVGQLVTDDNWGYHSLAFSFKSYPDAITAPSCGFTIGDGTHNRRASFVILPEIPAIAPGAELARRAGILWTL